MLKVGWVDYLNTVPLTAALEYNAVANPFQLVKNVPSQLNAALHQGTLDAGFVSSAEYLAHREHYELLPGFCIGACGKVLSVKFYHHKQFDFKNDPIGLTAQSFSSSTLLKVLCEKFWHVKPRFKRFEQSNQCTNFKGFLLIGDDCLKHRLLSDYVEIDLAEAWHQQTGLPFTFAVIAYRKALSEQQKTEVVQLQALLNQAYAWAKQNWDQVIQLGVKQSGLTQQKVSEYFDCLRYRLDSGQMAGLTKFAELSEEYVR
jgi:chorismate dehydratase